MDQAASLRELIRRRNADNYQNMQRPLRRGTRVIAVTSGKGGVGKSNLVANVAIALAQSGERVMILDADFGLANIDVLFGITPRWNLGHVVRGEKRFADILLRGPHGILLVPATSGIQEVADMKLEQRESLLQELSNLDLAVDYLLIDTASGIGQNVTHLLAMADEVIVVTTPEPTALVDAYAVIKLVVSDNPTKHIGIVVNQVQQSDEAELVVTELNNITQQFLRRQVELYGYVEKDPKLLQSVQAQSPLLDFAPDSPAGRSLREVARRLRLTRPATKKPATSPAVLQNILHL